ncbi:MAG: ATP-dependent DNA ligase [Gemmatimonadaceae bacterium]|nr:ATP-dependent DNA ligase [Gemmatimonadaceae bacterium]
MKAFADLYDAIDRTTATQGKVAALVEYFRGAPPADAALAVSFLVGRRPKRLVKSGDLRRWAAEAADVPDWLFEESYAQAGDLAETISLLVPETAARDDAGGVVEPSLAWWVAERLLPLARMEPAQQRASLLDTWATLRGASRFVFNKLITGAFRMGVSDGLLVRALSQVSGVDGDAISHRLMGQWEATGEWYARLVFPETQDADWSRPYPFYLAYPLEAEPGTLGAATEWQVEWKWDGIRAQLVRRRGKTFLWSRGEELLAGRFPEVEQTAEFLPDGTVIDGELVAWRDGAPLPFSELQRRINRKVAGRKLLADVPCAMIAYDLLEQDGEDRRAADMAARRSALEAVVHALPSGGTMHLSPVIMATDWPQVLASRAGSRAMRAEGLMLKRKSSAYGVGRRVGDWWKWKVTPLTVDAVLVYAQAGHGRRAGLYTDYTFAVWDGDALVPFAKAYSGLTDAEIRAVDRYVRQHTLEKFGPVRTVTPGLVFELAFEGIQESARHKSGIAVRFPRISRWRTDKQPRDADSLETIRAMLQAGRETP